MSKSLSGTLDTFALADLLQWIEINRLSGRLTVSRGEDRRMIDVKNGAIVFVSSVRPEERLGTFLVARGILPEPVVYELLADSFLTGRSLTRLVFETGLLSRDALAGAVEELALKVLFDLFHWQGARFVYDPTVLTEDLLRIQLSLRGQLLALEGARAVDDTARRRTVGSVEAEEPASIAEELSPRNVARSFFAVVEGLDMESPPPSVWQERFELFGRFSEKVAASLRSPFRPFPLFEDTAERCRAALESGAEAEELRAYALANVRG
ncbi:MAG TPA: DUF4388 domain-containing protein, partial [Thermoanaerobaculia bacterium]|nr:DUF4388 domain-containing protein [Thermoanaerobaculia bacterium]